MIFAERLREEVIVACAFEHLITEMIALGPVACRLHGHLDDL